MKVQVIWLSMKNMVVSDDILKCKLFTFECVLSFLFIVTLENSVEGFNVVFDPVRFIYTMYMNTSYDQCALLCRKERRLVNFTHLDTSSVYEKYVKKLLYRYM